jgi:2-keto-4-pentenoate hydratase/2-oxohepta-3-ene-1,7-dioic acid hydratase in catechol pathway
MKPFMFTIEDETKIGLENDGRTIDFSRAWEVYELVREGLPPDNIAFWSLELMIAQDLFRLETFSNVWSFLEAHNLTEDFKIGNGFKYDIPLFQPSKILALGRNYKAHAEEGGFDVPDEPIIFDKVITSMLAHGGDIVYPQQVKRLDHEIELAVVIGDEAKNVSINDAWDYVAGYTIANDISARDMQERDIAQTKPWLRSKNFDTFSPIGPYLIPKDAIPDAHNLEMELKVSGETRQKSNTSMMVFKIPEVISYISEHMTLLPGDIIMTGTPEGISPIEVGDVIEATIEGIGTLRNTVVAG